MINELKIKYEDYVAKKGKYFPQYWWAGKGMSFKKIAKEVGAQNNFLYDLSCYRVHAGITGASLRFDMSEDEILIGTCKEGKELPFLFTRKVTAICKPSLHCCKKYNWILANGICVKKFNYWLEFPTVNTKSSLLTLNFSSRCVNIKSAN